jgi:predicted nucleic acid-binding protein
MDSSAWYAAADQSDHNNGRAKEILSTPEPRITSDHILIETWLLLRYRISRDAAERFWDNLCAGVAIN